MLHSLILFLYKFGLFLGEDIFFPVSLLFSFVTLTKEKSITFFWN